MSDGVDVSVDPANCGACGKSCDKGEICEGGSCVSPAAGCPDLPGLVSGSAEELVMPMADDFVPLCHGKVLVTDMVSDVVAVYDMKTATRIQEIAFDTQIGKLAWDPGTNTAYVGSNDDNLVFAVDLETALVRSIDLPPMYAAGELAAGPPGIVFVSLDGGIGSSGHIVIVDTTKQPPTATETNMITDHGAPIAYDRVSRQLFVGGLGSLERFAFDADKKTLTSVQSVSAGSNCRHVTVSPAGGHVAILCGSGNPLGYTIADFDTNDLEHRYGEWDLGPYPDLASFSADGTKLVANVGTDLKVFDVETHALLESYSPSPNGCIADFRRVAPSRGGVLYAMTNCGDEPSGRLYSFVP